MNIVEKLTALKDPAYKDFQCKLMPGVEPETVLGVRMPALRKLGQSLVGAREADAFLADLPHRYYEEDNLHAFLLSEMKDYERVVRELDRFLPYVNNWATCDMIRPKIFPKHLPELREKIREWIASAHVYTCRFGIEMLMKFYLNEAFQPEDPRVVASIQSREYYVNMMMAWYFATGLAKHRNVFWAYLEGEELSLWVHNKTIQKAVESYRIAPEDKVLLRKMKRR